MTMTWPNYITEHLAEVNEHLTGRYTFNQRAPRDYDGPVVVFGVGGLGGHAHIEISTGRSIHGDLNIGRAGSMIMTWQDWLRLRAPLEGAEGFVIAEVRNAFADSIKLIHKWPENLEVKP
jgi:hypothetical protein